MYICVFVLIIQAQDMNVNTGSFPWYLLRDCLVNHFWKFI